MKKVLIVLLSMILILSIDKVRAETLSYSEWTTDYPSNIPNVFIETEDRYHFYKIVDGQVEYDYGYYTELDGYIKDEGSKRAFYRYITNPYLVFDAHNNIVLDLDYCVKSFCYTINNSTPIMINTNAKFEEDYSEIQKPVVTSETVPFTGDNIVLYLAIFILSILTISVVVIVNKRKNNQLIRA